MSILELWLPILLAGLATHIASTIAWTVMPHHTPEWNKLDGEDDLMNLLENKKVQPAQYIFPFAKDGKDMASEEYQEKVARCRGTLIVWDQPPNMGKSIGLTFAYFMVVAFATGYIASVAFVPGSREIDVFRLVFTVGLLCHAFSPFPMVFWFRAKYAMNVLDGVVYALVTAAIFAWLWPVG